VIWGPFLLALALGLLVSAGLYFAYLWPQVEPEEPAATPGTTADADNKVEPAPDKPSEEAPEEPPPSESA
jgi:hypothetical protein